MRPYAFSSWANSGASCACNASGKYRRAFFSASTFSSAVRMSFRFGAWLISLSYGLASGSLSIGIPAKISSANREM